MSDDEIEALLLKAGWMPMVVSPPIGMSGAMYRTDPDDPDGIVIWWNPKPPERNPT